MYSPRLRAFAPPILSPGRASQVVLVVKNPPANAGGIRDGGSIPGSGKSPGGEHGNPLQYFWLGESHGQGTLVALKNPMDREA